MNEDSKVQLVPVRTFSGNSARLDAELARGVLTDAGIECIVPGEAAADTFPFLDVPLLVRDEDAARAKEILESTFVPAADDDQLDEGGEFPEK
jgi:hypothetical protein